MKNVVTLLLALSALLTAQAPNTLSPAEKQAGWRLLFDGKTLTGWEDPAGASWKVADGSIEAVSHPAFREDLFSKESFGDFELSFEWKISPAGNSGLKYRVQDRVILQPQKTGQPFEQQLADSIRNRLTMRPAKGEEYPVAFEYQVIDNAMHPDAKRGPKYQTGALYDMVPPVRDASRPVGEFNQSRIVLRGDHVEHWLNGVKVVDATLSVAAKETAHRWGADSDVYKMLTTQPHKVTPITLQNHGDSAWFRSIKIHELH